MFSKISHAYINADTYAGEFFQNDGVYLYICQCKDTKYLSKIQIIIRFFRSMPP